MIEQEEPTEKMYKEDFQMKLDKIPEIEAKLNRLDNSIQQINKRIKKLQDQKEDRK